MTLLDRLRAWWAAPEVDPPVSDSREALIDVALLEHLVHRLEAAVVRLERLGDEQEDG